MDDRALVTAMVSRDPAGLDAAYRRYADRLFAYCVTLLGDREAAADAVQETFLLASVRAAQLRDPERLRPWLYAIARHECLRLSRARGRHAPLDEAGDLAAEPVDAAASVQTMQLRELIASAAGSLSEADRTVITLSVRHGLSAEEVAGVLGVSTNHAHARMSRARSQLLRALGALLVARSTVECAGLRQLRDGWAGRLTPLLRKRISRHIDECETCASYQRQHLQPAALLPAYAGLAFAAATQLVPPSAAPTIAEGAEATLRWGRDGFPRTQRSSATRRRVAVAVAIAMVLLLGGGGVALSRSTVDRPLAAGPTPPPESAAVQGGQTPGGYEAPPTADPDGPTDEPTPGPSSSTVTGFVVPLTATAHVLPSCAGSSFTLRVNVEASANLSTATFWWRTLTNRHMDMDIDGLKASRFQTGIVGGGASWWVVLKAVDGRSYTSPVSYVASPCPPVIKAP